MHSDCYPTRGATLVEVMAGLVLLGTLLVAIINAKGNHMRQWSQANARLQAIAAADELLDKWWKNTRELPRSDSGQIDDGKVIFDGQDLLNYPAKGTEMSAIRGGKIAMVFQEPMTSLNPVLTVRRQLTEALEVHMDMDSQSAMSTTHA